MCFPCLPLLVGIYYLSHVGWIIFCKAVLKWLLACSDAWASAMHFLIVRAAAHGTARSLHSADTLPERSEERTYAGRDYLLKRHAQQHGADRQS